MKASLRFVRIALVTVLGLQTLTGFPEEPQTKEAETAGNERELATLRGHNVVGSMFSQHARSASGPASVGNRSRGSLTSR
jgi:hypothetical protein